MNTQKLPPDYAEDLRAIHSEVCYHNHWSDIRLVSVFDPVHINGFVCRNQATSPGKGTESRVIKVIYNADNSKEFQVDLVRLTSKSKYLVRIDGVKVLPHKPNCGYILMEDCKGSLEKKKLPEKEVIKMLTHILQGLKVLHNKTIIHRDIKPGNILVREDGTYVLADFGISRKVARKMTPGAGTMFFQAPEILADQDYNFPADLYSVGLTVLTLLNGNHFVPKSEEHAKKVISQLNCSNRLKLILRGMLRHDPAKRRSLSNLIKDVEDHFALIEATIELEELKMIAKVVNEHCKGVASVHGEIVKGLCNQLTIILSGMNEYVFLSQKYNKGKAKDVALAQTIHVKVKGLLNDTTKYIAKLKEHTPSLELISTAELEKMEAKLKKELETKNDGKLVAFLTGSGTGLAVGGGIPAAMVAIPTTLFGESGALMLAGAAYPPALAIIGGAVLFTVVGLGLAALIRWLVNRGKKTLYQAVTRLLLAIKKLKEVIPVLQVQLQNTIDILDWDASKPSTPGILINDRSIESIREYREDMVKSRKELTNVKIPQVPDDLQKLINEPLKILEGVQEDKPNDPQSK